MSERSEQERATKRVGERKVDESKRERRAGLRLRREKNGGGGR